MPRLYQFAIALLPVLPVTSFLSLLGCVALILVCVAFAGGLYPFEAATRCRMSKYVLSVTSLTLSSFAYDSAARVHLS